MSGSESVLVQVRCPFCNRLAAEASPGSTVRVKCSRCGEMFTRENVVAGPR